MKLAAFFLLAFIAFIVMAEPVKISNNNVGDIVTVGVNANVQLSNEIDVNIVTLLAALLNQQALIAAGNLNTATLADAPEPQLTKS
jgi:hypothetical protein